MPVIPRKRQREVVVEDEEDDPIKRSKTKVFEEFAQIGYRNDSCHSIYPQLSTNLEYVHQIISTELVSLLNTSGGILCFGAKPSGSIYGQEMSRKDEDVYRCTIDEIIKRIYPMVKPSMYRVSFTPVTSNSKSRSSVTRRDRSLFVLEIRVQQGDPYQLYETGGSDPKLGGKRNISQSFLRDGWKIKGPLDPHQIKEHVTRLFFKKLKHEAHLASKLHPQSKPVTELHSTCNVPPGTEKVGVVPQMATSRCCKSKANDTAVISDECLLPSTSSLSGEAPPSQQALASKLSTRNKVSGLLKSTKRTVTQTFPAKNKPGTSSVTRDVINSENTFVKGQQPGRAVSNSMPTRLQREVRSGIQHETVPQPLTKVFTANPIQYPPINPSSQPVVATRTVHNKSAPPKPQPIVPTKSTPPPKPQPVVHTPRPQRAGLKRSSSTTGVLQKTTNTWQDQTNYPEIKPSLLPYPAQHPAPVYTRNGYYTHQYDQQWYTRNGYYTNQYDQQWSRDYYSQSDYQYIQSNSENIGYKSQY